MPGGHAPMVDFVDNPYLGELLNTLHEDGVLISLICHAPVAMVSAKYRVAGDGQVSTTSDHHFKGDQVETATNPAAVRVVYDEQANLLTGNGPQAIDDQAAKLRQLLDIATQRGRPATTRTPA